MRARYFLAGCALFALSSTAVACGDDDDSESVATSEVGECIETLPSGGSIVELPEVDCDTAHEAEVFFLYQHEGDDDEFPGSEEAFQEAGGACSGDPFEEYVGVGYDDTTIEVLPLPPSEESWGNGDRESICLLYVPDESVEGSLEGEGENYPIGSGGGDTGGGDTGGGTTTPDSGGATADDIALLLGACQDGNNEACDLLYQVTPVGSEEEQVGATCAGRSGVPLNGNCVATLGE